MPNIKRANALGITKPGTAIADVPDAPTIGTATGGSGAATVTYTAATTGGTATTFTATSSPGSITGTGASPITVSGLTNGTAYTFTVTASNSTGTSAASSASNSVTPVSLGDMDPIAMVEVGSAGSSYIEFTSIPSTYTHLQIRGIMRGTTGTTDYNGLRIQFNSDTGANYAWHELVGDGASANAYAGSSTTYMDDIGVSTGGANTANIFASNIIDILNYVSTSKNKTVRALSGSDSNNSYGVIRFASGLWKPTTPVAITSIKLFYGSSSTIAQYSSFALYGIKGD